MKTFRFIELTSTTGNITDLMADAVSKAMRDGYTLKDTQYSTSFDNGHNRVRSCVLIIMEREGDVE